MAGFKPQGLVFSLDVFMPGLECVDAFIARSCASISLSSCKLGGGGGDREVLTVVFILMSIAAP